MRFREERGSVTAEFAVALPAVVLVLAACLGGVRVGVQSLQAHDSASVAARSIVRGDGEGVARARAATAAAGATVSFSRRDGMVCATASVPSAVPLIPFTARATSCALEGA